MEARSIMRSEILDDATCDRCPFLDAIVLPVDDPFWAGIGGQPAHCNCRYMLVPLFDGIDPVISATPTADIKRIFQYLGGLQTVETLSLKKISAVGVDALKLHPLTAEVLEDALEPEDILLRLFGFEGQ